MAAGDLFKRAAAYRKKHKNVSQSEAVKIVSKMSGPKRKKRVGAVKKTIASPRPKKRVGEIPVALISGTRRKKATKRVGALNGVQKAKKLLTQIDSLENQRKRAAKKELKDIIQLEINARHDQLDRVKQSYRR